jgi:hypothetical protein
MGFIILANKMSGFKCSDLRSFARRKISGFKKSKKKKGERERKNDNPEWMCGDQTMVIPELPFILVSRSTLLFRYSGRLSPYQTDFCFEIVFFADSDMHC